MLNKLTKRLGLAAKALREGQTHARTRREVPPITLAEVEEIKTFFPLDKFFIFGHARSGTTLLTRLIRLHPEVHCSYQAHFFTRPPLLESLVADPEVGAWLSRPSNRWNHGRDLSPLVLRAAADFILEREARPLGKRITGDKSPSSLLNGQAVRLMHKIYPDGRLIYIARDGRDTVLSHRFQTFIEFPERLPAEDQRIRTAFIRDPQPFLSGERSLFIPRSLQQAAEGWVCNMDETDRLGKELFGPRYISLRYEDLVQRPWDEMSRLWTFLGADPAAPGLQESLSAELSQNRDAQWQQQKAGEIAGALQKGKQGSWREIFTQEDRRIFLEIAGQTLAAWGYEK